jgi:hypothetical protein
VDQAKDKVDLTGEMTAEVEMTAGAVVAETAEAVAVETVVARVAEEDKKNLKINRFENLMMR